MTFPDPLLRYKQSQARLYGLSFPARQNDEHSLFHCVAIHIPRKHGPPPGASQQDQELSIRLNNKPWLYNILWYCKYEYDSLIDFRETRFCTGRNEYKYINHYW